MSTIRPLEAADVPEVCGLFEAVARSGRRSPPPQLVEYFERTLLKPPWQDPEIPSMVYAMGDGRIVALIASHVRRLRLGGRPARMAYTGLFVADPDPRFRGVGGLLLKRFLAGPQDATMTDGGNDVLCRLSQRLGTHVVPHLTLRWTRLLRPFATGAAVVGRRSRRPGVRRSLTTLAVPLDVATTSLAKRFQAPASPSDAQALTPQDILGLLPDVDRAFDLRIDYDEAFLGWLFRELPVVDVLGLPVARLVRVPDGTVAGWYVYYLQPGGFARVLQVATLGSDPGVVLDDLFSDAARGGAVAIGGRVENHLFPALLKRRCVFHRASFDSFVLVHSRRPDLLGSIGCGRSLLSRLDGESWMGYRILWREDLDGRGPGTLAACDPC